MESHKRVSGKGRKEKVKWSSPKADQVEIDLNLLSQLIPPWQFEIELFSPSNNFDLICFEKISLS